MSAVIPDAQDFKTGSMSSINIIGETTEAIHKLLLDSYDMSERPPRLEEDLKFVPKDREEVVYVYMYRTAQNPHLNRQKRLQLAPVEVPTEDGGDPQVFYHRPPIPLDLFYLICVHSKFRSDAERLLGWAMMVLHYTPRLVHRPRRFALPDGRIVDSKGRTWDPENTDVRDLELQVEKVSLALVDDLTLGDAVNLYTLHEAPYRPFLTYRARALLGGPLVSVEGGSTISMGNDEGLTPTSAPDPRVPSSPVGRMRNRKPVHKIPEPPGPKAHNLRRRFEKKPEETDTED